MLKKMAQDKMKDPKFRKQAKAAGKKVAIKAIKLAIQQIGIPFDDLIDDISGIFNFDALNIDLPSIDFDIPQVDLPDVDFGEGRDEDESVEGRKSWESRFPKTSSKIPIKFEWLAPGNDVGVDVFSFSHQDKPNHLKLTKLPPKPPKVEKKAPIEGAAAPAVPIEGAAAPVEGAAAPAATPADVPMAIPEGFYGGWGAQVKLNAGRFGIRHVVDAKKFVKYSKNAVHHDNAFKVIRVSLVQPNVG